ncbi:hypothetical protein DH20_20885 [Pantoea agglomerans]|nr:hypothetical protein [Pantoea agglomerans]
MREETDGNILHRTAFRWGRRREEEKRGLTPRPARCRAFFVIANADPQEFLPRKRPLEGLFASAITAAGRGA